MSSTLEQQAEFLESRAVRYLGGSSALHLPPQHEHGHITKMLLLVSYSFMGRKKSFMSATHPTPSVFCPAASATKHLLSPHAPHFKPELYEPKNLLQTAMSKPRGLELRLGFAHKHPNSSECQVHGNTRYFLISPPPRVTRDRCYRSWQGALSEGKLLKIQLAGIYCNVHIKLCW